MNLKESLKVLKNAGYELIKEDRYNEYSDIGMDPGWDGDHSGRDYIWIKDSEFINTDELADCSEKYFGDREYLASMCSANGIKVNVIYNRDGEGEVDSYGEGYYGVPFYYPNINDKGKLGELTRKMAKDIIDCIDDWELKVDKDNIKNNMEEIFNAMDTACEFNAEQRV